LLKIILNPLTAEFAEKNAEIAELL
jgi:hypothetical protein